MVRGAVTLFGRAEHAQKDELFDAGLLDGQTCNVRKLSLGCLYETLVADHLKLGVGGLGSVYHLPDALHAIYGNSPFLFMLFSRISVFQRRRFKRVATGYRMAGACRLAGVTGRAEADTLTRR